MHGKETLPVSRSSPPCTRLTKQASLPFQKRRPPEEPAADQNTMHPVGAGSPSDCEKTACGLAGSRAGGRQPPAGPPAPHPVAAVAGECGTRPWRPAREQAAETGRGAPARATQSGAAPGAPGRPGPAHKGAGARAASGVLEPRDCPAFGWPGGVERRRGERRAPARNCSRSPSPFPFLPSPLQISAVPPKERGGRGGEGSPRSGATG